MYNVIEEKQEDIGSNDVQGWFGRAVCSRTESTFQWCRVISWAKKIEHYLRGGMNRIYSFRLTKGDGEGTELLEKIVKRKIRIVRL